MVKKFLDGFSRLDAIPACDRQTPHDGKDRAMQSVTRVKNTKRRCRNVPFRKFRNCRKWPSRAKYRVLFFYGFDLLVHDHRKFSEGWGPVPWDGECFPWDGGVLDSSQTLPSPRGFTCRIAVDQRVRWISASKSRRHIPPLKVTQGHRY